MSTALDTYAPEAEPSASYHFLKSRIGVWPSAMVLDHAEADCFTGDITDAEHAELVLRVEMELAS